MRSEDERVDIAIQQILVILSSRYRRSFRAGPMKSDVHTTLVNERGMTRDTKFIRCKNVGPFFGKPGSRPEMLPAWSEVLKVGRFHVGGKPCIVARSDKLLRFYLTNLHSREVRRGH